MPRATLISLVALIPLLLIALAPSGAKAAYGDPPVIHSAQAIAISTNAATLQVNTTPNENFFEVRFSYCRVGVCPEGTVNLPLLTPTPEGPGDDPGLNPQVVTMPVSGLLPSTEYEVTVSVATDTWYGGDDKPATVKVFTFKTQDPEIPVTPVTPKPTTGQVTGVTATTATLNGILIPGTTGAPSTKTSAFFQWGPVGGGFPNSTPTKQFPTDASEYPTSAGLSGLQPGKAYQARLVATRGGAQFIGATVQFTTQALPSCPAGTQFETVSSGNVVAVGCFKTVGGLSVAQSELRLNGVLLKPVGGKKVQPPSLSCGGGSACDQLLSYLGTGNKFYLAKGAGMLGSTGDWRMDAGPMENLYSGPLKVSNIDWNADKPLMTLGVNAGVELLDFPLAGKFSFTPNADGSSRFGLLVGFPVVLGGVTGDTAVKINPGGDMSFDRIEISVGEVPIKKVTLGGLRFLYDRSEDLWEGEANITLPTPSQIQVGVGIRVKDGKFNEFKGALDNINYHITYGIYLQRIDVLFGLNPIRVGGGIGLTAGPKYAGISLIGVDGNFLFNMESREEKLPNGAWITYPPSLRLGGSVSIFSIPVREGSVEVYFTHFAWVEAQFKLGHTFTWNDIAIFGLEATLGGSLKQTTVDIWGTGGLTVFDFDVATASAILNNNGLAACGKALGGAVAVGGYFPWKTAKPDHVWYCDMDKLR